MFELAHRLVGLFKMQDCTWTRTIEQIPEDEINITGDLLSVPS
jgi:hypothetical protein